MVLIIRILKVARGRPDSRYQLVQRLLSRGRHKAVVEWGFRARASGASRADPNEALALREQWSTVLTR